LEVATMSIESTTTFAVDVTTAKGVEEAVAALGEALRERNFAVLWDLDIREKLKEKGIEGGPPFRVLEVCSAPKAKEALDRDVRVGYFLPCKMVVYRQAGTTHIGVLRPTTLIGFFEDESLHRLATEVEATLRDAAQAAAQ
jgi:uncharacterized protein (DUF302 family)